MIPATLGESVNALPNVASAWAFSLVRAPHVLKTPDEILKFLNVEKGLRYKRKGLFTYCNVFAHDYCHLRGVYLPRVWWSAEALLRIGRGEKVDATYAKTLFELNANSLYEWLRNWGQHFNWTFLGPEAQADAQIAVNRGAVGLLCAKRTDPSKPGHITCIVPERYLRDKQAAYLRDGKVLAPLQAQAGAVNFSYGHGIQPNGEPWQSSSVFQAWGIWINKTTKGSI